ncbi:hypothetical protein [Macrococcus brunensis]|uniref:hypothetical protein n=1 Tax=Macrococcus brunensis TaxID=198483 RepID=UPI001EF0A922|nr:hypothetical protein [Macrococcus brunensis]ULG71382.1 hypothetical protein MGG12_08540 [Macrococcus brunensis]
MSNTVELLQEMKAIKESHYKSRTAYNFYYDRYDKLKSQVSKRILDAHPIEEQLEEVDAKPRLRTKHHILADYLAEEQRPFRSYGASMVRRDRLSKLERELQIVLLEEFLTEVNVRLS